MQTDNLELKKLVYLYLMNYAKSQPDMAIMAVNTFVKVSTSEHIFLVNMNFIQFAIIIAFVIKNFQQFKFSNLFLNRYKRFTLCILKCNRGNFHFNVLQKLLKVCSDIRKTFLH